MSTTETSSTVISPTNKRVLLDTLRIASEVARDLSPEPAHAADDAPGAGAPLPRTTTSADEEELEETLQTVNELLVKLFGPRKPGRDAREALYCALESLGSSAHSAVSKLVTKFIFRGCKLPQASQADTESGADARGLHAQKRQTRADDDSDAPAEKRARTAPARDSGAFDASRTAGGSAPASATVALSDQNLMQGPQGSEDAAQTDVQALLAKLDSEIALRLVRSCPDKGDCSDVEPRGAGYSCLSLRLRTSNSDLEIAKVSVFCLVCDQPVSQSNATLKELATASQKGKVSLTRLVAVCRRHLGYEQAESSEQYGKQHTQLLKTWETSSLVKTQGGLRPALSLLAGGGEESCMEYWLRVTTNDALHVKQRAMRGSTHRFIACVACKWETPYGDKSCSVLSSVQAHVNSATHKKNINSLPMSDKGLITSFMPVC